jgi:hypothetical protein
MSSPTFDLDDLLTPEDDPRFIDGIFNYCTRRCEPCAFQDRCRLYRDLQEQERSHPEWDVLERVRDNFQRTFELLRGWCAREGIDFETLQAHAESDAVRDELRKMDETRSDPLQRSAEAYTAAALKLVQAIDCTAPPNTRPDSLRPALDTIAHLAIPISSKIHRALSGYVTRDDERDDEVQNDWNGSAKVARTAIADTTIAWETVLAVGETPADSPLRKLIGLLQELDAALAQRFPRALEFVRPGFDEPDIAAGALSTLAPFHRRPDSTKPRP